MNDGSRGPQENSDVESSAKTDKLPDHFLCSEQYGDNVSEVKKRNGHCDHTGLEKASMSKFDHNNIAVLLVCLALAGPVLAQTKPRAWDLGFPFIVTATAAENPFCGIASI